MQRLTILDENYIMTESVSMNAIREANKTLNEATEKTFGIICEEGEDIRFAPTFLQVKAEINPVNTVNNVILTCMNRIRNGKNIFTLAEAAILSSAYNRLFNVNTEALTAFEEATTVFAPGRSFAFNLSESTIELSEPGVIELRKKLGSIRESASKILSELNIAVADNSLNETSNVLNKIILMDKFVSIL